MSKEDDFFDKYVENTSSKPKRKGSVKKDLFGTTSKENQEEKNSKSGTYVKEEIVKVEVLEEVKNEIKKTTRPPFLGWSFCN